ncbi:MAG: hypothetical protein AAGB46_12270 [Verrucomicrobiota bacterium]
MSDEERPPPSMKVFIFPAIFAVILGFAIHFASPDLGIYAWGSGAFASFFVLSIWGLVMRS